MVLLSLMNHFYWDIPEARIPFILADVLILATVTRIGKTCENATQKMESLEQTRQQPTRQHLEHQQQEHQKGLPLNGILQPQPPQVDIPIPFQPLEVDKTLQQEQAASIRQRNHVNKQNTKGNNNLKGGKLNKHFNIQQPSKN